MVTMKVLIFSGPGTVFLAGCTNSDAEIKPVPGSVIQNSFYGSSGSKLLETCVLQKDRNLKLTRRDVIEDA
jgi:hypothetical protein